MKSFMPISLIIAGICLISNCVVAQIPGGLPKCLNPCLTKLLANPACPGAGQQCICTNKALIAQVACCVGQNCDAADTKKASNFANSFCARFNVKLPQTPTCGKSGGGAPVSSTQSKTSTTSKAPAKTGGSNSGGGGGSGSGGGSGGGSAGSHVDPARGMAAAGVCAALGLAGMLV